MAEETKTSEAQLQAPAGPPPLSEPDPARRPARLALYLGVVLIAVGALALYLGYDQAAKIALVQAQIPYLISGGLTGVALLTLGGITIALYVILQIQADFRSELNGMRHTMERLSDAISYQAFGSSNGKSSTLSATTVLVARGSSSFHRADCRLVERAREQVRPVPRDEAEREGLLPCRICKP